MQKICPVCEIEFKDKDKLVAAMLSEFKEIASDVHFAIAQPTQCLEIFHIGCYDGDEHLEHENIEVN